MKCLASRKILAIADVYDALTARRHYREAFAPEKAVEVLREEAPPGLHDSELVEIFVAVVASPTLGSPQPRRVVDRNSHDGLGDSGAALDRAFLTAHNQALPWLLCAIAHTLTVSRASECGRVGGQESASLAESSAGGCTAVYLTGIAHAPRLSVRNRASGIGVDGVT